MGKAARLVWRIHHEQTFGDQSGIRFQSQGGRRARTFHCSSYITGEILPIVGGYSGG
jgi:hypothetical protein